MKLRAICLAALLAVFYSYASQQPKRPSARARGLIIIGAKASQLEQYAAKELQRYLYQITGTWLDIKKGVKELKVPSFVIGTAESNPAIGRLIADGHFAVSAEDPGPQGYVLKRLEVNKQPVIAIAGSDEIGCVYGVYGLLGDYYHIGFFLGGDVLPDKRSPLTWVDVDERKAPAMSIRGFLPWTNFPQSATVYSWEDWKFIIDQMAKMRMNFIHIHNYNGELGHNEMYHNFTYKGYTSRVWMPTARTGHKWACPGWEVNKYLFGASDLFDDYDFGADCALHNENLSNEEVFRKSASLFRKVIEYAHTRSVKIGLGLDINLIPEEYKAKPEDPEVVQARVDQLVNDYPDLDYLLCFQSEVVGKNEEFHETWRRILMGFYDGVKARMPGTRVAVAGWGLDPKSIETLPADVISAPISPYSDACESGAIYGGITVAGLLTGWLLRGAKTWFTLGADILRIGKLAEVLTTELKETRREIVLHIGDTKVHIVPDRDEKFYAQMIEMFRTQFATLNTRLESMDGRCVERLQGCATHFSLIDQQMQAKQERD